ncbi:MAG: alpha-ketoglutarate-dependent dioxygenase AlkB [Halioglobus sp.]
MSFQSSLLDPEKGESLPLTEADLVLFPNVELGADSAQIFTHLQDETPWSQETIKLYGKTHLQPRLIAWYGDPNAVYAYSGKQYQPLAWTPLLNDLKVRMESICNASFNSVLLNFYRDGADSMGLHADDEPELGPEPCIASLSLGEERTIYFKHKKRKELKSHNVVLPNASVLRMQGETQQHWKHGIRKVTRRCGPRINLTFRWIYSREELPG